MKRFAITLGMFIITTTLTFGQAETLFQGDMDHGGFGGLSSQLTSVNGEFGAMLGGYGAWLINHRFALGGGGFGLANNVEYDETAFGKRYISFDYGGLLVEYIHKPDKLIHFTTQLFIGGGEVNLRYKDKDGEDLLEDDHVFVVDPRVNVELNITSYMRILGGAGYRLVSGVGLEDLENTDFSNPGVYLTIRFGSF